MKKAFVTIRENATNEIVVYEDTWDDESNDGNVLFQWLENNYSCDCNRERFFKRAKGIPLPDEIVCGDGRYDVIRIIFDGKQIYRKEEM